MRPHEILFESLTVPRRRQVASDPLTPVPSGGRDLLLAPSASGAISDLRMSATGVSRQVDAEQPNFRTARQSAGTSQSRTWGQYRLSPGVEAVLVAQPGIEPLCRDRVQVSYPLEF